MSRIKKLVITSIAAATLLAFVPSEAHADGPLRQWLRGLWGRNCNTCQSPTPGYYQPTTAAYTPNAYNLQPGQCMKTCQQTCTRTVVNYVPQTAYRTTWNRVPVTQYKPVTNSDPATGCTVTCMRPCTTYTYQCQRVPYTTYRPVYRQESYKVPVTTITNDCATGNCGPCNTGCAPCNNGCAPCNTGVVANPVQNFAPTPATTTTNYAPYTYGAPQSTTTTRYELPGSGTIATEGSYSTKPADVAPSIHGASSLNSVVNPQTTQRPFLERFKGQTESGYQASSVPARINVEDRTARAPTRKEFAYSPIRMASHQTGTVRATSRAAYAPARPAPQKSRWVEVQ